MPTVRRGERQVSTNLLPGVRKSAHATALSEGAGVADAERDKFLSLAHAGSRVQRIGLEVYGRLVEEERQAADETALLKAGNELSDWKNKRVYDPNTGALTQKGEAALKLPEELRGEFDEVATAIEKGLGSDRQRAAFARLRVNEWDQLDVQVRRHVFGEMQTFRAGELESLVANSTNAAMKVATDPKLVAIELQKATSAIRTTAPRLGLGAEAVDAKVRAVETQVHTGVIAQLLALEKDREAKDYFESVKDRIAGDKYDEITKALDEGQTRGESMRKFDAIVAEGGTFKDWMEKAKAIDDPKLRDAVEQRLEHRKVLEDRQAKEELEAVERNAYGILDKNPDITQIPPADWTRFDGGTRAALTAYARARAKGEPIETDYQTYYELMSQAAEDPQAFAGANLLRYRAKLGESEFKQLVGVQASIKSGDRAALDKDVAPFQTRESLIDNTLALHGIDPKVKADTPEGRAIAQLRRMVERRVDILQAGGKKASNADIQAEIDTILSASTTVPGSWWNIFPGGKSFTDQTKRVIDLTISDVPAGDRQQIEAALRARNRPITDATILDLYIETKARGKR